MKKATATSHGNKRLLDAASEGIVVVSGMLCRFGVPRDSMLTQSSLRGSAPAVP
jgi:hypothetical protein